VHRRGPATRSRTWLHASTCDTHLQSRFSTHAAVGFPPTSDGSGRRRQRYY
jgi:hypothetical protein